MLRLRSTAFLLVLASSSLGTPIAAWGQFSHAQASSVRYTAVGPAGLKIVGKTGELAVTESKRQLSIRVPLRHLETGIDLRDRHMKEKYLQVSKYPLATLTVDRSALKFPQDATASEGVTNGKVQLHGRSRILPFHYRLVRKGPKVEAGGALHLNMSDFGIEVPSYLGVGVEPEVDVEVAFTADDQ